jgi:hypothetical protein
MHRGMVNQSKPTMSKEFGEQKERLSDVDEHANQEDQAALGALGPPKCMHTPPRHPVCGAGQRTVPGCRKISVICGGCGTLLVLFVGGVHD